MCKLIITGEQNDENMTREERNQPTGILMGKGIHQINIDFV